MLSAAARDNPLDSLSAASMAEAMASSKQRHEKLLATGELDLKFHKEYSDMGKATLASGRWPSIESIFAMVAASKGKEFTLKRLSTIRKSGGSFKIDLEAMLTLKHAPASVMQFLLAGLRYRAGQIQKTDSVPHTLRDFHEFCTAHHFEPATPLSTVLTKFKFNGVLNLLTQLGLDLNKFMLLLSQVMDFSALILPKLLSLIMVHGNFKSVFDIFDALYLGTGALVHQLDADNAFWTVEDTQTDVHSHSIPAGALLEKKFRDLITRAKSCQKLSASSPGMHGQKSVCHLWLEKRCTSKKGCPFGAHTPGSGACLPELRAIETYRQVSVCFPL